ncbi:MAG: hypothetical protein JOZ41_19000 [Chloroflexi bacterium]|nr:hypothetical protein [Chloroflexota bacterium]
MGAVLLLILSLLFNFISQLLQPSPVSCTPPQCKLPPPKQGPLTAPQHYTSSQYGFSLEYSTGNIPPSQTTASSIAWDGQLSDGSEISWSFSGSNGSGQSPQQLVTRAQSQHYPDAQLAYTVPDASLGYTMGYGNVYDVTVSPAAGESEHDRLLIFAAVRGGVAVTMIGLGPYQQASPNSDSQPNPADTPLVELGDFEENLNSVTWKGEEGF